MIDLDVHGRMLEHPNVPPIRALALVVGTCGCEVWCGHRQDNGELAVAWHPCPKHTGSDPAGPQEMFRRSITEGEPDYNPQTRPVWEVIDDMLGEVNRPRT